MFKAGKQRKITILCQDGVKNIMGGLGIFLQQIMKNMPDVYFVILGVDRDQYHHGKNYVYYPHSWFTKPNKAARILRDVRGSEVLHANDANVFELAVALKNRLNIPLISQIHLSDHELIKDVASRQGWKPYEARNRKSELHGLRHADLILHVSEGYAKRFPTFGNPVRVLHNGIDIGDFNKAVKKVALPGHPNSRKLLYIGRISHQKGITNIMQTQMPANTELYVIGDSRGGDRALSNTFINWCIATPRVHYLGAMWGDDKISVMQQVHGQLIPSIHEPFGIVGLEAMATKSLVITSYAGGLGDFIPRNASLDAGYDAVTLQRAINKFSQLPVDKYGTMVQAAFQTASYYGWTKTTNKLRLLYNQLSPYQNNRNHYEIAI